MEANRHSMFLMCEDLTATMGTLSARGAVLGEEVSDDPGVGRFATIRLPGGGTIGLY